VHRRVLLQGLLFAVRQMREVAGGELLRLIVGRASGRPIQGRLPRPSHHRSPQPLALPCTTPLDSPSVFAAISGAVRANIALGLLLGNSGTH
jgi:hypothetical protein